MNTTLDILPTLFTLPTRRELGDKAGSLAAAVVRSAIARKGTATVMLAAAPSQAETLRAFVSAPSIDWSAVEFFHMDDYVGLPSDAPQGFGNWLQAAAVDHLPGAAAFHRIDTSADPEEAARHYEAAMGDTPFDLVFVGLGVNGHLAFNDPPADLADPRGAKVVALDQVCRQQQVDEGHFPTFDDVPGTAITVTIPRLLNAVEIVASVPGVAKRKAVADSLSQPISGDHPGTALRTHPRVTMFLDAESDPR
ncbi:glucosamine-6-phosphate deaminase [Phytoactinopolyspora alkaliphila]|uniref:Glucosamine-6-phosphate deaminase n=1 Tax=Phytoactinopolyspora alkaliphila TaxID=1783498 RepID=A0A6N9YNR8_9ACTN|nr:6-phosphogluconolactonase [Phytoactinopolyspora alkaliphila]NED96643.1 glucosamine-6-phosphate deaminase [Phytoactinopolyspora alkaliphila]